MTNAINPLFSQCKAVFATHLGEIDLPAGHVLFNAARPIHGNPVDYDEWCFGRFYSSISPTDEHAEYCVKQNIDLDARIVIRVTEEEACELVLANHRYAEKYREYSVNERMRMLMPSLSKKQHMPYPEAMELLSTVRSRCHAAA